MSAVVYRLYDEADTLLYIGSTGNFGKRLGEHRHQRPEMMARYVRGEVERYDDRAAALKAERIAIHAERPPFNVMHNDDSPETPLSHVIDQLRRQHGLTWRDLAAVTGESTTTLHRNIVHRPDDLKMRHLRAIAGALDLRLSSLIRLTEKAA